MKINYGVIACVFEQDGLDVLHFCGYDEPPTQVDIDGLKKELTENPEFGLSDREDWVLMDAPRQMVEYYKQLMPPDEDCYFIEDGVRRKYEGAKDALS